MHSTAAALARAAYTPFGNLCCFFSDTLVIVFVGVITLSLVHWLLIILCFFTVLFAYMPIDLSEATFVFVDKVIQLVQLGRIAALVHTTNEWKVDLGVVGLPLRCPASLARHAHRRRFCGRLSLFRTCLFRFGARLSSLRTSLFTQSLARLFLLWTCFSLFWTRLLSFRTRLLLVFRTRLFCFGTSRLLSFWRRHLRRAMAPPTTSHASFLSRFKIRRLVTYSRDFGIRHHFRIILRFLVGLGGNQRRLTQRLLRLLHGFLQVLCHKLLFWLSTIGSLNLSIFLNNRLLFIFRLILWRLLLCSASLPSSLPAGLFRFHFNFLLCFIHFWLLFPLAFLIRF
mmetsp:Transcript_31030/g.48370  ORF Transcript_31030/g.48370 Transcript_31030/m.48370 type:complete len:340 (+) Transcript_31030:2172-3191(+)